MLPDSHCHLQFNSYKEDFSEVLNRCNEKQMILNVVGSQKDTSKRAVELAEKHKNIYATVGLHPTHLFAMEVDEEEINFNSREEKFNEEFYSGLINDKVIAVGEIGLDLFHLPKNIAKEDVLERQKQAFVEQYNFAKKLALPIVIHVRSAHEEMVELLKSLDKTINGVVHCYTGDWYFAEEYLKLGLYLGFTGVVTFPAKKTNPEEQEKLLEVLQKMPLNRILVETDAPYLAPQAYRGQKCEPWMVEEVVKKVAEIKGISVELMQKMVLENTLRLFTQINLKNS